MGGFNLHADVMVRARDRQRLERMARYVTRPPLATERLRELPDGSLLYELRRPWADGTKGLVHAPLELLEKLVALVPAPRRNTVRYHGALAPHARRRHAVARDRPVARVASTDAPFPYRERPADPAQVSRASLGGVRSPLHADEQPARLDEELRARRLTWAELTKRVFL